MQSERDSEEFEKLGWRSRRLLNAGYAGPRLRAVIRSSQTFIPRLFWVAEEDSRRIMAEYYSVEREAIRDGDAASARAACVARSAAMAEVAVAALWAQGVLDEGHTDGVGNTPHAMITGT